MRLFRNDDRDAVFSLYRDVFGEEAGDLFERRWDWQFEGNPARQNAPLLIWLAEKDGEIVGHLASFPQRMKVVDQVFVVYHDCDLIVSPKVRRQGVGRHLVKAYDTCPNPLSNCLAYAPANGRIRERLGYRPANAIPRYLRPYDVAAMTNLLLSSERLPRPLKSPPATWVLRGLSLGLSVVAIAANAVRRPRPSTDFSVESVTAAGTEFDDLWARLSPQFVLSAIRDRQFVNWRFIDDPLFDNSILVARDNSGVLVGYLALRVWKRRGVVEGRIMDLFCPPESQEIVDSLLHGALLHLKRRRVDLVSCWGLHPGIRSKVRRHLYLAPSNFNHPSWFLWKGHHEMSATVYNASNWHLSCADSDIGFSPW